MRREPTESVDEVIEPSKAGQGFTYRELSEAVYELLNLGLIFITISPNEDGGYNLRANKGAQEL